MIDATTLKILNDDTNNFISKVKQNLASTNTDATGKTSRSLHYAITEEGSKIVISVFGRPFFAVVETGRKPTPGKKPSKEMIDNLTAWCAARSKPESAVWAIAVNIQNKGTELFRKGGRTDIYTDEKEGYADNVFMDVTESIANDLFRKAIVSFS